MPSIPAQYTVATARHFPVPVDTAYAAWTDSDQVQQWWGPHGFSCPLAQMDVRDGGTSRVAMRAAPEYGGVTIHNSWHHTRVEAPHLLVFESRFTDPTGTPLSPAQAGIPGEGVPEVVPHVVTFAPLGDQGTVILVLETGYTTSEARDLSRRGLEQCLDKLADHLTAAEGEPAHRREGASGEVAS